MSDSAPCPSRDYFPQKRRAPATPPPPGAPTLADIVWSYWDDLDYPESPIESTP